MRKLRLIAAGVAALTLATSCTDHLTTTEPGLSKLAPQGALRTLGVTGAAFTTTNPAADVTPAGVTPIVTEADLCKNGNPGVNCNIYGSKSYVWLNGGPSVAYVGAGTYFFA